MAKGGVLGNDPFRRGAAARTPKAAEPEPPAEEAPAPKPKRAKATAAKKASKPKKAPRAVAPEAPAAPEVVTRAIQDAAPEPRATPLDEAAPPAITPEPEPDEFAPPFVAEEEPEAPRAVRDAETRASAEPAAARPAEARPEPPLQAAPPEPEQPLLGSVMTALSVARQVASQTFKTEGVAHLAKAADGVFAAVMTAVGAGGAQAVDEYGKDAELTRRLTPISDFFYERYWRVTVEGSALIPAGPAILVANHSGAIPVDGFILHQAFVRERPELPEPRWLTEDQIFHSPFLGTLYNRLGAIRASPENAVRLLREGRAVITFPEGVHGIRKPFQERYQLKRLGRGGFVKLAIREKVPIVPVAIVGAEESMPLLAKLPVQLFGLPYVPVTVPPLPAKWSIRFGEPISVADLPPEKAEDLLEVQRVVERTRESIEGMIQALLKDRRSVFGG